MIPFINRLTAQDQQRHEGDAFQLHLFFKLVDDQGQRHRFPPAQEGHGGNGHHGVDEEIGKHFPQGGTGLRDKYPQYHTYPADTQGTAHSLQVFVELAQGIVGHQIGGGEEMDHVHQNQDRQRPRQEAAAEEQGIGEAQHHTGDG